MTVPATIAMPLMMAVAVAVMVTVTVATAVMVAETGIRYGGIVRATRQHQSHNGRRDRRKLSDPT